MSFPLLEFRQLLQDFAGVQIILGDQNGDRPGKVYGSIRHEQTSSRPHLEELDVDEEGMQNYRAPQTYEIQLQIYGPGAYAILQSVSSRLKTSRSVERTHLLGLSVQGPVVLRNAPSLLDNSQYEERAILEMNVCFMDYVSDESGIIQEVPVDCHSSISL